MQNKREKLARDGLEKEFKKAKARGSNAKRAIKKKWKKLKEEFEYIDGMR